MELFAPPVERLIEEFAKLPGIGQKTAQRLAFHVLDLPKEDAERFADAIREAKAKTFTCRRCQKPPVISSRAKRSCLAPGPVNYWPKSYGSRNRR